MSLLFTNGPYKLAFAMKNPASPTLKLFLRISCRQVEGNDHFRMLNRRHPSYRKRGFILSSAVVDYGVKLTGSQALT